MPAFMLCAVDDIETILSAEGVQSRLDDRDDGTFGQSEMSTANRLIIWASSEIASKLNRRYIPATYAGNSPPTSVVPFVRYMAAVMATHLFCTRRGLNGTKRIVKANDEAREWLREINKGERIIPGANDDFEHLPCVSNLRVDGRFGQAKIRRQVQTSTGRSAVRRKEHLDYSYWMFPWG